MKRSLLVLSVLLLSACGGGADMTGTWTGTITAPAGSYADTWQISEVKGEDGVLDILTTGTCTEWGAHQSGNIATWGTTCSGLPFSGSLTLSGSALTVSIVWNGANGNGTLHK